MKNFFYKGNINITHDKEMFEYLKKHFQYFTMSSWNGLKSIANNVKVYKLNLDGDHWQAYRALNLYGYDVVNEMIEEWEGQHPGYRIGFNGRSDGYLVLYNSSNNLSILPDRIESSDTYNDYKEYCKEEYGSVYAGRHTLVELFKLVRDFDKFCDDVRSYVNGLSQEDVVQNAINMALDTFNSIFHEEMELLGISEPECLDNYQIKIDPKFSKYKSLRMHLCEALAEYDLDYAINKDDNTIDILEEKS